MKILQIITLSDLGGAQSVLIELTNSLVEKGHDLTVLSKSSGAMWSLLNNNVKKIEYCNFSRSINPLNDIKSLFYIKKILKDINPEIIHLHSSKIGVLGRLAAFPHYSKKIIYTIHGFDTILKANKFFLPLEKILKNQCSKIIAVSKYDQNNLKKYNIKNTAVIYNAISDKKNNVLAKKEIVEKIKICAKDKKIILTISRIAKQKRFDLYKKLAEKLPQFCFIWIGNKEPIQEALPENLFCLGEIPNAGVYIKYSDLFILFANYEGLPVSIIEALSCGIPALASKVGGNPEILDNTCGYALENDIVLFKEKIIELFSNKNLYESLKKGARQKYENEFTIDVMVNNYLKVYEQAMMNTIEN